MEVAYIAFILDFRPLKDEYHRVCITVGGNQLTYPDNAELPAANMMTTKILLNSIISDTIKGAIFIYPDTKKCLTLNTCSLNTDGSPRHQRKIQSQ